MPIQSTTPWATLTWRQPDTSSISEALSIWKIKTRLSTPINIQLGYLPGAPVNFVQYRVCKSTNPLKNVNPADPSFIVSPQDPANCPVFLYDNKTPQQTYTFTVTQPPPQPPLKPVMPDWEKAQIPTADVKNNLASWSTGNNNPTKYNTVKMINCIGNQTLKDSQSSQAWCCTLNRVGGIGVFGYSTPVVPATAHTILNNVVTTVKAPDERTSNARACNMGIPVE
jgi:hypothetical protein